jgi:hypothetical protein
VPTPTRRLTWRSRRLPRRAGLCGLAQLATVHAGATAFAAQWQEVGKTCEPATTSTAPKTREGLTDSFLATAGDDVKVRPDVPVRLVHWLVLLAVALCWYTAENRDGLASPRRLCVLTLVLFRLFWGFSGSSAILHFVRAGGGARVSRSPARACRRAGRGPQPAGGWSVLALLRGIARHAAARPVRGRRRWAESGPLSWLVSFKQGRRAQPSCGAGCAARRRDPLLCLLEEAGPGRADGHRLSAVVAQAARPAWLPPGVHCRADVAAIVVAVALYSQATPGCSSCPVAPARGPAA